MCPLSAILGFTVSRQELLLFERVERGRVSIEKLALHPRLKVRLRQIQQALLALPSGWVEELTAAALVYTPRSTDTERKEEGIAV